MMFLLSKNKWIWARRHAKIQGFLEWLVRVCFRRVTLQEPAAAVGSPPSSERWQALGRGDPRGHKVQIQGRATQGVRIMNIDPGDEVAALGEDNVGMLPTPTYFYFLMYLSKPMLQLCRQRLIKKHENYKTYSCFYGLLSILYSFRPAALHHIKAIQPVLLGAHK